MKTYQYQLIHYIHDHFTGEFIIMGVIMYSPETKFLDCKVATRYQRLNDFFPSANGKFTRRILLNIQQQVKKAADTMQELFAPSEHLSVITQKILPNDNSAIRLSEVKTAIDIDMEAALNYLFYEMVEKSTAAIADKASLNDEEVWKTKYKEYFDKYGISGALTKHTVDTPTDEFNFDMAWENEVWHCYEPVSFYLVSKDAIKDKVYRWAGKVKGMQATKEKVHLTLLASLNPEHSDLKGFIDNYIEVHNNKNITVDVVLEQDADAVARNIRKQMDEHNLSSHS